MDEEGPHKHFLVTILTVIQATPTLVMNPSTHTLTVLVQVLGSLVVPQDMVREYLALDTAQEQEWVISLTSHGHLPQVTLTWWEPVDHLFLH